MTTELNKQLFDGVDGGDEGCRQCRQASWGGGRWVGGAQIGRTRLQALGYARDQLRYHPPHLHLKKIDNYNAGSSAVLSMERPLGT